MLISQLLETRTTGSQNSRSCQTAVSGQDGKCSLRTGEEKISWWFFKKKKIVIYLATGLSCVMLGLQSRLQSIWAQ